MKHPAERGACMAYLVAALAAGCAAMPEAPSRGPASTAHGSPMMPSSLPNESSPGISSPAMSAPATSSPAANTPGVTPNGARGSTTMPAGGLQWPRRPDAGRAPPEPPAPLPAAPSSGSAPAPAVVQRADGSMAPVTRVGDTPMQLRPDGTMRPCTSVGATTLCP